MATVDATALRTFVYDEILARGRPPRCTDIGAHFRTTVEVAREALATLSIGKTILVDPRSGEIWMAGPFSANETSYRVEDGDRSWWANCAWDMFGVAAIVGTRVTVHTSCGDCGEPMRLGCDPNIPPHNEPGVVHFLVPARQWYDDIGFT
jgi:Alkylmercury lyase